MLSDLIKQDYVRAWHQGTLFAPYLDAFVGNLASQGFQPPMLREKLCAVTWFAEHLKRHGVQAIAEIKETHVADFLGQRGSQLPSRRALRRSALRALLRHLEGKGVWTPEPVPTPVGPVEDFYRSLADERGLRPASIQNYRHYVGRFLRHIGCDGSHESLAALTAKDVDRFVVKVGPSYGRSAISTVCSSVRGLLRFLYRTGVLKTDLSLGVLMPRLYAFERLPCALPWETVKRIFDVVDTATPCGRRDLGILWLLVTYGLRPGEVEKLRLEDIDWRRDMIRVRRSKSGRPLKLPLTREVGEAILAYLKDGRPKAGHREIFLRAHAPYAPLHQRVGDVVRIYLDKAGIESRRKGAYVIRHSFAVHLLRQGEPLKTITDLLGHADPHTAYQYTRLAVEDLHDVALPGAEVMP
jgi:site-specific recombinase XerD